MPFNLQLESVEPGAEAVRLPSETEAAAGEARQFRRRRRVSFLNRITSRAYGGAEPGPRVRRQRARRQLRESKLCCPCDFPFLEKFAKRVSQPVIDVKPVKS